jgi:UDP-glucose 4-epimerase
MILKNNTMSKTNNILITGGAGYIGSHIVEKLVKKNSNIFILDNLSTGFKKLINKKATFIKGNIGNYIKVKKIIDKNNINSVIHLAAHLNVSEAEKHKKKYNQNNILGTLKLIKACQNSNVKSVIFSSSCSVYGSVNGAVNEKKKTNPQGHYAYTKYKGEQIIKMYAKKFNYKYVILRYFNVAGASNTNKIGEIQRSYGHLIKNLAIQYLRKKPKISIYGNDYKTNDGTCVRDYIHVSDLADVHIKSLKYLNSKSKSIVLNCGYGKGYSVLDIVNIFKKIKKNVIINFTKKRPGDVAAVYADVKKIKKILKWKPKHNNLKLIMKSAFKWEKIIN